MVDESKYSWLSFEWFTPAAFKSFDWAFSIFLYALPLLLLVFLLKWLIGTKIKQKLADRLHISGIPCLVALDKNGLFLSDQIRNEVTFAAGNETKCKELINKWKNTEAVPIEDAKLSGGGPRGILSQILMKFLSNPMYMVGLYYLFKKLIFKFQEIGKEHEESEL